MREVVYRGGGSATATMAMAVAILKHIGERTSIS